MHGIKGPSCSFNFSCLKESGSCSLIHPNSFQATPLIKLLAAAVTAMIFSFLDFAHMVPSAWNVACLLPSIYVSLADSWCFWSCLKCHLTREAFLDSSSLGSMLLQHSPSTSSSSLDNGRPCFGNIYSAVLSTALWAPWRPKVWFVHHQIPNTVPGAQ